MGSKLSIERIIERPSPEQWGEDELMTLAEAARLFWPKGPLTEETLRTAVRDGRLPVSEIARKLFVTKVALRELNVCRSKASEPAESAVGCGERSGEDYAASIRVMGRCRSRRTVLR